MKHGHKAGQDEKQCRRILSNAVRYNLSWICESFTLDKERDLYIIEKYTEHDVRPAASVCYAVSVALKFAKMNEHDLGISPETALIITKRMIKGVASAYKQNRTDGNGWGFDWQSAFWATLAGQGAWLLWNELDSETQTMVCRMVISEADRFIADDYKVPYWMSPDGKENTPGDTKAEENAWNSGVLSLAVAMMPLHSHCYDWRQVCNELIISAFATKDDLCNEMFLAVKEICVSYADFCCDYRCLAQANIVSMQKYRIDAVSTISDPMREGADMGMALEYPEDGVPHCAGDRLIKEFAKAQIKAGADIIIGVGDAIASVAGPNAYQQWALPYEIRLLKAIKEAGAMTKLHICGNTTPFLELLPADLCDIIDVDWMVPLEKVASLYGDKVCVNGNYDPVAILLQGNVATVKNSVKQCAGIGGLKYTSSVGCEVPKNTPQENLLAVYEALEEI
ncbi:MAG: uroporphyrinogen decarboxylase family protein [Tannerella sp.]|nr:uroporphyrinogen decarboxylase family protein [Tannerella sp.]